MRDVRGMDLGHRPTLLAINTMRISVTDNPTCKFNVKTLSWWPEQYFFLIPEDLQVS